MAHNRDYREPYREHHGDGPYVCGYPPCGQLMTTLEVVHHIDEDHTNNVMSNLMAMHTDCHNKYHHLGLKHRDEIKAQIGVSVRAAYADGRRNRPDIRGEKNPFYGRKHTAETRAKISAARRARDART